MSLSGYGVRKRLNEAVPLILTVSDIVLDSAHFRLVWRYAWSFFVKMVSDCRQRLRYKHDAGSIMKPATNWDHNWSRGIQVSRTAPPKCQNISWGTCATVVVLVGFVLVGFEKQSDMTMTKRLLDVFFHRGLRLSVTIDPMVPARRNSRSSL